MSRIKFISIEELLEIRDNNNDSKVIEVLSEDHFKNGHIPSAINIPLDELNEETIKNFLFAVDDVLSPDSPCIPDNKDIGGIAVQTVISFEDYTVQTPPLDMKKANVIMLFVIPKKN